VREVDRLRRALEATLDGDPWYGSSVSRMVDGVDPSQAAAHPVSGAHSIWELVLHMTAWVNEANRRLRGGSYGEPEEGDWPGVPAPGGASWQSARSALAAAHSSLAATLTAMSDAELSAQVPGAQVDAAGQPVTLYQTAVGILQHDAYHAGQIAILKKALRLT
jgi:uncharacterized damage-inducible protein DinB